MSARALPPFDRPGTWRAKITIYRDDIAIATADTHLTDDGSPLERQYAVHTIGTVLQYEAELTARGRREQAAADRSAS